MNKIIGSSLLLLSFLSACAPKERHTLVFVGPDADKADFLSAVSEWKNCPNAPEILLSETTIDEPETKKTLIEPVQADYFYDPEGKTCDGYTFPPGKQDTVQAVQYARGTSEGSRAVILHELGHVFGLSHHTLPGAMNPVYVHQMNQDTHLTEADCEGL